MERTVPSTASEEIDLFLRTVYSLLRSTTDVQIRTLEEVHVAMNSLLHPNARKQSPDTSAFIYSLLRLPDCMPEVRLVVLGQSSAVFERSGYGNVESWQPISARARRRRCFFNGQDTLACFIASRSDIDDVIPSLTAYQVEWNKLHFLLQRADPGLLDCAQCPSDLDFPALAQAMEMSVDDLERMWVIWGERFNDLLHQIAQRRCSLRVRLLSGSLSEYWRATRMWWDPIELACPDLLERPVYFVSSNTHSMANLLSGYALQHENELVDYLSDSANSKLLDEWTAIQNGVNTHRENFLYYVLKKFQQSEIGRYAIEDQTRAERAVGMTRIPPVHALDIEAQVIELARLDPALLDPRLLDDGGEFLRKSNALILNIDYPLGLAAYNILNKVAEHSGTVVGVYVMGKSATLNGVLGDVMIPNVVQDEHSRNTYLFKNAFSAADVAPYLEFGTVLDNQKAVSVLGTFLQNARIMDVMYREGYTDIEMESGPYLSAVYEMYRPQRHPVNELVNLYGVPFDVGILHYVSDTPLSKGKNLGAGALSYFGMDSTYATTITILRRILQLERARLSDR
ncbi:hypothetical protein LARV_03285 [Longilinea arvoryzae]|uniref:Uncharacterized protein n=1 Tax=Longilinea arvoryzae TaxID=360412 RepID=A0A0S7BMK0_9CHLR|nr:hypothetical protein [Longilinea arvoryzae]GAP15496.1 hypothetical protein LARV_03285 [Longilinea arvoryzae]